VPNDLIEVNGPGEQLLIEVPGASEIIEVGLQGPPGPPGSGAGGSAELAQYPAGTALSGHAVVMLNAFGVALPASSTLTAHLGAIAGITEGAAAEGAPATVRTSGLMQHAGWTWMPDMPVFAGTNGALVQALPPSAKFIQLMGWARSPTLLLVAMQQPVVLSP
jgi:hypothetical protein